MEWNTWILPLLKYAGLWSSALLFVVPLRHKAHWVPKTIICALLGTAMRMLILSSQVTNLMWLDTCVSYAAVVLLFYLCADVPLKAVLYCGLWTQITYQLWLDVTVTLYAVFLKTWPGPALLSVLIWGIGQVVMGLTLARWMPDAGSYHPGPRQLTSAFLLWALLLVINWLYHFWGQDFRNWNAWLMVLFIKIYCTTILYLQHNLFQKSAIQQELDIMNHLRVQQKNQYDLSKENIALINQKCHDLKHQIKAMRTFLSSEQREEYLREIEQSVRIYEVLAKTGNEVLDTVLTEKSLYCEANGIQAHCVADGRLLDFMDPIDLYTIFGNAMDNAIESVSQNADREKRLIDVMVYEEKKMLVIQIINPLDQALQFDLGGLPQSTKMGTGYHGYGLRSIRHTVKKYGGYLTIKAEEGCFYLQILIP